MNISIYWFMTIVFSGGISISIPTSLAAENLTVAVSLHTGVFPSLTSLRPVWYTQIVAYAWWLPGTMLREAFVPSHLAGVFTNGLGLIWNILFSLIIS